MSCGMPRFVARRFAGAGGQDRERRLRAGHRVDRSAERCRRRPRRRAAPRRRRARVSPASGRTGSSTPRSRADRRLPGVPARAAAPAARPERLAGVRDDRDLRHLAALPAARVTTTSALSAAIPTITPPATSIGWCMPRYMRENATIHRDQHRDEPDGHCAPRFAIREVSSSAMPAVDGDRRRGMPRRVARVHRQVLEAVNLRTMAMDEERRRAIRAGLEGQREEQESGQPPALRDGGDQRGDARDDRQHDAAAHDGARQATRLSARSSGGGRGNGPGSRRRPRRRARGASLS